MRTYRIMARICFLLFTLIFLFQHPATVEAQHPFRSPASEEGEAVLKDKPFEEFERKTEKVEIEKEEEEVPPDVESETQFLIEKINVTGNRVIASNLIEKITSEYENRELTLSDLIECANKITALYASEGYITTQAYVPPQKVENKTITIEVIEGEYGDFDVQGARYTREAVVRNRLKKKPHETFNYNQLRKDMLYLNTNPDRVVRATMVRGRRPKTTDFDIRVKDRPPLHLGYELSNTGSKSTGLWRHSYKFNDTGLFLYDDGFNARYIMSDNNNLHGIALDYTVPINEFGTKFSSSFSHFQVNIGHDYEDWQIKSRSTNYSFYFTHPVFDWNWLTASLDAGLDVKESRTESRPNLTSHVRRESRERLRVLNTGLTLDESDSFGRTVLRNGLSWQPRNFMGSMDNLSHTHSDPNFDNVAALRNSLGPSRARADGTFVKYNYKISRLNRLPFSSVLLLNVEGQATNNLLYGSEQHRIGGAYSVRGYAEGEALGDYGANATAEVRFPFHFIPPDTRICGINPRRTVQGVGFLDWGLVHSKSSTAAQSARHNEQLVGTGFGLRINFFDFITGRFDVAWPIGNRSSYGREARLHVLFSVEEPTLAQYQAILEDMMQQRILARMKAVARDVPDDVIADFERARLLEEEGRYEEARELYVSLVQRKNEIMTNAQSEVEDTIRIEEEAKAYLDEAESLYRQGKFTEARELYREILVLRDGGQL